MSGATPFDLSAEQRAFIEGAEARDATAPSRARALSELPRLSSRQLDDLVECGLVREAADGRYYVFQSHRRNDGTPPSATVGLGTGTPRHTGLTPERDWKAILFWIFIILIPILLIYMPRRR